MQYCWFWPTSKSSSSSASASASVSAAVAYSSIGNSIAKVRLSYCFTVWLALGSPGWLVGWMIGCLSPCQKYLINPYNAIFLKSQWSKDIKNDILDCQIHKYKYTNTQIHKYSIWERVRNTIYTYIFEKPMIQGHQK